MLSNGSLLGLWPWLTEYCMEYHQAGPIKIPVGPDQYPRIFMFPLALQYIVEEDKHNIL